MSLGSVGGGAGYRQKASTMEHLQVLHDPSGIQGGMDTQLALAVVKIRQKVTQKHPHP